MNDQREKESSVLLSAFRRIEQRLKRTARSMLGCKADAEDVLQETFVRLWSRPRKSMAPEQAEALLTTTVRNLSIDVLRGRGKCSTEEVGENVAEEADDTNEAECREQMFLTVEKIIDQQLSPVAREILHRREYEGESFEDIAASLDMQPAAVRMQLSRARKIIRTSYLQNHHEQ